MSRKRLSRFVPRASKRRDALQTQARLLAVAGRLFATQGFEDTKVRQICRAAHVNVAAIRHHFGSKEALYRAVVLRSHQGLLEREPLPRSDAEEDAEDALEAAVAHMLRVVLVRRAGHPYAGQLIARELQAPTAALDELIDNVMKPVRAEMSRTIGVLLGDADSPGLRGQCTNFVTGLCIFHELGKEVLKRFGFPPPRRDAEVPELAAVITQFALGGIERLSRRYGPSHSRSRAPRA
jgi:AcrR family transcriptional regulator